MGRKNRHARARWTELAESAAKDAREAGQRERRHQQRLDSGASTDRQADRYFATQAGEDRRLSEANELDFRNAAGRRGWWR